MPSRRLMTPMLVGLLLGLGTTIQMRMQNRVKQTQLPAQDREHLVGQLISVTDETQRLRTELRRLEEAASQEATSKQLQDELQIEQMAAGLQAVKGPGITVMMTNLVRPQSNRRLNVEHVLLVLNELRAAGAEAIAVNGVRTTPHTSLARQPWAEGAILVNGQPVLGFVVIEAVGDAQLMSSSLNMRGGVGELLSPVAQLTISRAQDLLIPAVDTPVFRYARPKR